MPGKYTPADHEAAISKRWETARAFHADPGRVLSGEAEPYCILIPPPNVTGALHLGHAFNNTIQDMLVRAHRMKGFETLWMPGTDHAGIATQAVVDKRLIAQGEKALADYKRQELEDGTGREAFIGKVLEWKDEYLQRITGQLRAMGCSCDWERQRFTMDDVCARGVREAFFRLFKDGLIYRGKRLVNWDPVTQTALADDEVEMEEVESFFWYMRYPIVDRNGTETGEHVTVATTRPETYFGDTAVAVNPKDPERAHLIGQHVKLPFVGRVIPIIGDDYVVMPDPESSDAKAKYASGFLKVTPAHDPNDYDIGQRHDLPIINVMAPDASISADHGWEDVGAADWAIGKSRENARQLVEAKFSEAGLLAQKKPYTHSVGHSYRSHAVVEPYLSDQWYVKVTDDRLRGEAQRALNPSQRTDKSLSEWPESAPKISTEPGGIGVSPVGAELSKQRRNLPHWQMGGSTYFVTFRVSSGELTESERSLVLDACLHWHGEKANVHLVTVMPDHVHLLLTPERSGDGWHALSELTHSIKSYTAHELNKKRGSEGPVWQSESFDRIVRDQDEFDEKWNYMLNNPVKAGLAGAPTEYPYTRSGTGTSDRRDACPTGKGASEAGDGSMTFHPPRYAKNYEGWHDNLRDWCISRQLWWGHRIPVWRALGRFASKSNDGFNSDLGRHLEELEENGDIAVMTREESGLDWTYVCVRGPDQLNEFIAYLENSEGMSLEESDDGRLDPLTPSAAKTLRPEATFVQDPDVLDTWFSSALWPLTTMGWPEPGASEDGLLEAFKPTSVLCTAREIITLWVSRMVMFNRYFAGDGDASGDAPFKDVFIHAMIQDGDGRKMSKSLGNGVDPLDIIDSHGTDAMRFTLAQMATQTQDVRMPVEHDEATGKNTSPKFDFGRNFCNKLWNASRFVITMLSEHATGDGTFEESELTLPDRWILSRLEAATRACDEAIASYQFASYAQALYDLLWRDYCDWYVEAVKPTLKTSPTQQAVLRAVLDAILRLLHPITPFVTEAIFDKLSQIKTADVPGLTLAPSRREGLLCLAGWPEAASSLSDSDAERQWSRVQGLIGVVREVRAQQQVKPRQRITLHVPGAASATIQPIIDAAPQVIEFLAGIGTVTADEPEGRAVDIRCEGLDLKLSQLSDEVDAGAEIERIERELSAKAKSIAAMEGRLNNPGYADKAPAHLVQQTRDQLEQAKAEHAALAEALGRLK